MSRQLRAELLMRLRQTLKINLAPMLRMILPKAEPLMVMLQTNGNQLHPALAVMTKGSKILRINLPSGLKTS